MKFASVVAELPIVSINEGDQVAIVKNLFINRKTKRLEYLSVVKSAEDAIPCILCFNEITGIGNDFIVIPSIDNIRKIQAGDQLALALEDCIFLPGRTVISTSGDVLGQIKDYELNKKTGAITKLLLGDDEEIEGASLLTLSPKFIVVSVPGEDEPETSLDDASMAYLVGKTVSADVTSTDGAFTIPQGTVLTKELIVAAEDNDIIVQLTMAVE